MYKSVLLLLYLHVELDHSTLKLDPLTVTVLFPLLYSIGVK